MERRPSTELGWFLTGASNQSVERRLSPLFSWRSSICDSDLEPTARHVALTLSLHMNERGGSAFPSAPTLARETGLHERTVRTHLNELVQLGWLARELRPGRVSVYSAAIPDLPTPGAGPGVPEPPLADDQGTPGAGPDEDVLKAPEEQSSTSSVAPDKPKHPSEARKAIWDALALAAGVDVSGLTRSAASDFAKTVKELVEAGAEPAQVADFARWWRQEYQSGPNPATLTHRCFRQHWPAFLGARTKTKQTRARAERRPAPTPPPTEAERQETLARMRDLVSNLGAQDV
jgi:hypothetical protein